MQSKKHCPKCKSFNVKRVRRGFFKRVILQFSPRYSCMECDYLFSEKEMNNNEFLEHPGSVFLAG